MIGAVLIGRNEGERLVRCLASVAGQADRVVYVDSGSTDGSAAAARAAGAEVVDLDMDRPFTAARARNAGLARLTETGPAPDLVQFVDGDCEVQPGWIATAAAFLADHPQVAAVCGRRRERFPAASIYNRLIDTEWDTPVGEARACGGDALMRVDALQAVGGFNPALIAGEEPELCVRLRQAGWTIWRLDAEMTLHDAAMTRFSQWWTRARRAGHAFAEGAALHGAPPERHKVRETRRALAWGVGLPLLTLLGLAITPWALVLLLAWPAQMLRLRLKGESGLRAVFLTLAKLPEGQGVLSYWRRRLTGGPIALIEYK
ncbi:Glycosyl transferase, group 2 family protein (plasmid) [Rhodovulum sp. P5]|uniref:glycosyltransferase family 2 protein n=1 Tax=Rhodovulum sp. P5 TaxID=1564506 RepID=UPI0009C33A0C|nr:glycosyltransferase [Rhodovulum sp. P5]ARE42528.1 Glycosyl transferase, group 2 family protein [Rhodovulum sp. P5]